VLWPGVETIRVRANGINFEVMTAGAGNRLALCLHGFPQHSFSWRHQVPVLLKLGYRVWAPNLRGYGNTDSPAEVDAYRLDTLVRDVAELIKASGAGEVLLIGHDWGAMLAWRLAAREPSMLTRLVIMNVPHPACFWRELRRPKQMLKSWYVLFFQLPKLPEFLLRRGEGRAFQYMFRRSSRAPERFPDEVIEVYRQNAFRPGGLTAMINWYRALGRHGLFRQMANAGKNLINVPTLFIWGDADVALSIETTRGTEAFVQDLTLRVLRGVSHWVQEEEPEAVNTMLEAWLTGARVPEFDELKA
jgi:epoxide hydrolase 4